jgi:photosystem II stability/assembly factor-like uncharacterized protein
MKKSFTLFVCLIIHFILSAQTPAQLADSVKKGFRGLSVVNENVLWMSGQKGLVGNSYDGGKKWKWNRVKGFEKSDFRSIYAFDKKNAVIANAGFPATILFTTDGGKNWTTSYSSKDSAMFFDGIDFWTDSSGNNKHGMIFGDPLNGRMYLSETVDGGKHWKEIPFADRPQLQNGEASFAASGTTIRTLPNGQIFIATGGSVSRLWHSRDYGHHWEVFNTPILQGKPSQGIFSIAFYDTLHGIIVGGDYLNDTLRKDNCFLTVDGGKTWKAPGVNEGPNLLFWWSIPVNPPIEGYFSDFEFICNEPYNVAVMTGTSHTYFSTDMGQSWYIFPDYKDKTFNTIRVIENKKYAIVYFCGGKTGFSKTKFRLKVRLR